MRGNPAGRRCSGSAMPSLFTPAYVFSAIKCKPQLLHWEEGMSLCVTVLETGCVHICQEELGPASTTDNPNLEGAHDLSTADCSVTGLALESRLGESVTNSRKSCLVTPYLRHLGMQLSLLFNKRPGLSVSEQLS